MGEGLYAYRTEYKTTTTMLVSSSSSSLVYLRRVLATSLTATRSRLSVNSFVALGPCVRVVVVGGCWSFDSRCEWSSWLLGGRCRPLGAGRRSPFAVCVACGCRLGGCRLLGGRVRLCWELRDVAAGDVEGALVVVDAGDVGV